jgi:hypothetical protein
MPSGLFFFATESDLKTVLNDVDNEMPLEFLENGFYASRNDIIRLTPNNIPNLGISRWGDHCDRLLFIVKSGEQINYHKVQQEEGIKYSCDGNSDGLTLWPGGFYGTDFLIVGRIDTLHNPTKKTKKMYKLFQKHFKKHFKKKVGYHYIGSEAHTYAGKIRFITISIKSPPEYDLKII